MRRKKMTSAPQIRDLDIRDVGARGDGVARSGAGGAVYVPLTLAGEQVRATVEGDRGELIQVLRASPERIAPPCPHFGTCGGCSFQHWHLEGQLDWKSEQVR
ncbi:MAG TPA: hypothetical protein PLE81_06855, partial [Brevundimonas sp.]|nr:hypothetical protein [Brevundimonas sp.]